MGTFDGVHLGHQEILKRVTSQAGQIKRKSVLVTYHPHPQLVLRPEQDVKLLTTLEEKIKLIESFGIDQMIVLNFDQALANTSARQFVDDILVNKLSPGHLIVGYNHGFGKDRQGGIKLLQETGAMHDFPVEVVPAVKYGPENISSSKVRRTFQAGDFNSGIKMLGHSYPLQGTVKVGTGLGKKLGYPTCNLKLPPEKLLPPEGIYSCRVDFDSQTRAGMAYLGRKPTLLAEQERERTDLSVEVHLFDFQGNLYDCALLLNLEEWIRPDQKFLSIEELQKQIELDEKIIKQKLNI